MPIVPISLALRSNPSRYGHAGAARLINMYAEEAGEDAKAPWNLHAVDGLAAWGTASGVGGVRAFLKLSDAELYAVIGRSLWRFDASGSATLIGGIPTDGLVTMARNRQSPDPVICIVSQGLVYYCQGGVLTRNEDPDLPAPISVTGLDGYFLFLTADGRHFASALDGTDVSAIDYASAEANPDPGVRNWTRGRDHCIGGSASLEFWQNTGAENYSFTRTTVIDVGILAADSVANVDQTSAFVAHDGTVRILDGYQAARTSDHAVERFISAEPDKSALSATSWSRDGHVFYALSGTNGTWVYDLTTKRWHERQSYGLDRWRCSKVVQFANKNIAGHYDEPSLYVLDSETYDEDGTELVCTVQCPPVTAGGYAYAVQPALALDIVPGVGLVSGTEYLANPHVMMDYSDDGGRNFGVERSKPIGRAGQTNTRVMFTRLGRARNRTYRFRISAAVARSLIGAAIGPPDELNKTHNLMSG